MLKQYVPLALLALFVVANAVILIALSQVLSNTRKTAIKSTPYESGIPVLGTARERFSVKFYLVAMLFIVFDLETVFMIPWAQAFRSLGLFGLVEMGIFILILAVGYTYGSEEHSNGSDRRTGTQRREHRFADFATLAHHPPGLPGQLGPLEQPLAHAIRHRVLCHRVHGHGGFPVRHLAVRDGAIRLLPASGGCPALRRSPAVQAGAGHPPHLRPDAPAEVGDLDGGLCLVGRDIRQLRHGAGHRHRRARGRVRPRVSSPARGPALRHPAAPEEGAGGNARGSIRDA